jgi:hypothetical protein
VTTISADAAISALARSSGGSEAETLRAALLEIWGSVVGIIEPEEQAAVLYVISPQTCSVGSANDRARRAAVAASLYPSETPAKAVARFRRVLGRASVRAVIDAMLAEQTLHKLASRDRVREALWSIAMEKPPTGNDAWEPKDIAALTRNRLSALKDIVALDLLAEPAPPLALKEADPDEGRNKLLTRLGRLWEKPKREG